MTNLKEKLKRGIAAAQADNKKEARTILIEVVEADQTQVVAWLWLYKVVDSLEEKAICLENVLTLEPDNDYAQERLARVKAQQERLFNSPYAPGEEEPPPAVVPIIEPELPIAAEYPHEDEFDNELLCPYCVALTRREDRICPNCKRSLIVKKRVKEERTAWLWRGFFLQIAVIIVLIGFGASYFTLVGKFNDIPSPVPFLPLYFGQSVDQPEHLSQTILEVFPLWAFWGLIGASLYSLILLILLYVRIPYGNVVYLINATILLGLGIIGILFYYDSWVAIGTWGFALLLGSAQMFVTLNLWNDFTFKERRLILRVDPGVKGYSSLAISGRDYFELGIWGLAIIHLRRAIAKKPNNLAIHVRLVTAYMKIKRHDLAEKALKDAEREFSSSAELTNLRQKLDDMLERSSS